MQATRLKRRQGLLLLLLLLLLLMLLLILLLPQLQPAATKTWQAPTTGTHCIRYYCIWLMSLHIIRGAVTRGLSEGIGREVKRTDFWFIVSPLVFVMVWALCRCCVWGGVCY